MALVGNTLYVADTDAILKLRTRPGALSITAVGTKLVDLPAGTINHHWTKNVIANGDGSKLYVTVGSNSITPVENGIDKEEGRAAIWEVDVATGAHRIFASGLRNPNGLAAAGSKRRSRGQRWRQAAAEGRRVLWVAVQLPVSMSTTCSRNAPSWSRKRSRPTMRLGRTPRRLG